MDVTFTKTDRGCNTQCTRPDGSVVEWESPDNGKVPHDIVRWIVESKLDLHDSFYGNIALGEDDRSVNELAQSGSELAKPKSSFC